MEKDTYNKFLIEKQFIDIFYALEFDRDIIRYSLKNNDKYNEVYSDLLSQMNDMLKRMKEVYDFD